MKYYYENRLIRVEVRDRMLPNDKSLIDERMLTSYLLGELSQDETERLDELSITDDEIALRLDAVEAELVDAHVRGELSAEESARVSAYYAATARRREKIEFARALARTTAASVTSTAGAAVLTAATAARRAPARDESGFLADRPKREFSLGEWLGVPRFGLQWGFAAAALVIAAVAGYLFLQNRELLGRISTIQSLESSLEARQKELQARLATDTASEKTIVPSATDQPSTHAVSTSGISTATVLLMPQLRGAAQPVGVLIERGAAKLPMRLGLESTEFSRYTVALRDPSTGKIVWSSGALAAEKEATLETVAVGLPGKLLKQQNYSVELSGVPASGQPELINTYAFHAFLR